MIILILFPILSSYFTIVGVMCEITGKSKFVSGEFSIYSSGHVPIEHFLRASLEDHVPISYHAFESFSLFSPTVLVFLEFPSEIPSLLEEISNTYESNPRLRYQRVMIHSQSVEYPNGTFDNSYVQSLLENGSSNFSKVFDLNNSVFIILPNGHGSLSVWEFYWVKELLILRLVESNFSNLYDWVTSEYTLEDSVTRRNDWGGVPITAAVSIDSNSDVNSQEASVWNDTETQSIRLGEGYSSTIFWDFREVLNFTEDVFVFQTDGKVFNKAFNTSFYSTFFDIYISHFAVDLRRASIAQFLQPTSFSTMNAYFVQPSKHSVRNSFSQPFSREAWIAVTLMWTVVPFLIYGTVGCYETFFRDTVEFTKDDALLWSIATACQRSWQSLPPKHFSVRVILYSALTFSFFWYNGYTTMILSELKENAIPIRSLGQLMDHVSTIYMSTETGASGIMQKSMEALNPERSRKVTMADTRTSWMATVLKTKNTFITWPEYFSGVGRKLASEAVKQSNTNREKLLKKYKNVDQFLCQKFSSFAYFPFSMKISMFVHRGSPLTRSFNYRIIAGWERGLIRGRYWKIYTRNTRLACIRTGTDPDEQIMISLSDTEVLFLALALGGGSSLAVLLLEKFLVNHFQ